VTTPERRSAAAALDHARPVVARLDISQHPEELAADLIEGWTQTQAALRALIGSSALSGQALIRELRQRELLTLDQAHALVEFSAAHERAQRTEYRPTHTDVAAARAGFQQLEAALSGEGRSAPRPAADPSTAGVATGSGPFAPSGAATPIDVAPAPPRTRSLRSPRARLLVGVGALVLLVGGGGLAYWLTEIRSGDAAMRRGRAAYRDGDRVAARNAFAEAIRQNPDLAEPHIYLGRMAREEGDVQTAGRELQTAIQREPDNALALREMGAHLLATGNLELARRFYVRAVQADPTDSNAMGFLGCTLIRLGNVQLGMSFLQRAGQGSWSACAVPPGGVPGPGVVPPPAAMRPPA
jgi:tetratricopeptide (TPR) repeat protein